MTLEIIGIYAIAVCLLIGAAFALVGVIGLIKFNDPMTRLHAPTKVGTMGIGMLLLASVLHSVVFGDGSMHELLIAAFLFVTAPISAHFLAKVSIHNRTTETPPPTSRAGTWSTLNTPDTTPGPDKAD